MAALKGAVVFGGLSSDVEAITVGFAVLDAPRVMVDETSDAETPSSPDSEVASRVGVAGDLGCQFTAAVGVGQIWCVVRSGCCVHRSRGRDVRALGDAA